MAVVVQMNEWLHERTLYQSLFHGLFPSLFWPCVMLADMKRKIFFDIETKNTFRDVGKADPTLLDISVVGIYDSKTEKFQAFVEKEFGELWPIIEKADMLIGYNSDHFDIPLLNKYYLGDLSNIKSLDIMKEVGKSLGRKISLDLLGSATLGRKKTGKGLEAVEWWANGEYEKVKEYCLNDVRLTRDLYNYIMANKQVKYVDRGILIPLDIDTSGWETKEDMTMARSLF